MRDVVVVECADLPPNIHVVQEERGSVLYLYVKPGATLEPLLPALGLVVPRQR